MNDRGAPQTPRRAPLFLERQTYRRRRLIDAARLLPFLGIALWAVPLMWSDAASGVASSSALIYVFGVWAVLIVAAFLLSMRLGSGDDGRDGGGRQ